MCVLHSSLISGHWDSASFPYCLISTWTKYIIYIIISLSIFPSLFRSQTWYDSFVDTIKSAFDFSLFLDNKFAFFNLSTLFLFIW